MCRPADKRNGRIGNGQMARLLSQRRHNGADRRLFSARTVCGSALCRLFGRALRPVRYTGKAMIGWLLFLFVIRIAVPRFILRMAMWFGMPGASTLVALGITLITAGALLLSILQSVRLIALLMIDLSAGKVAFRDGRMVLSREEQKGLGLARLWGEAHMKCAYVIGGEYFEVDEGACAAPPTGRWRVYHTPRSRLMLSLEPVPV